MDRFRLLERIGSGGMGTVYRAFDERLQRHVAVKELAAPGSERVLREAQAAARLNHPAIVTLYEYGTEGSRALLVSELVDGQTLAERANAGELTDRDVAEIGADLADALAHAHSRGVVHRDVKPQNVVVRDAEGGIRHAKLMDFGIARLDDAVTLTAAGEVLGTLAYMSPEQSEGEPTGPATDAYSLALTLYECWTGENPVRSATPAQTVRAIGAGVPLLAGMRPDLPGPMTEVIDACLDPDPEARPDVEELGQVLERESALLDDTMALPIAADEPAEPMSWTRVLACAATLLLAPLVGAVSAGAVLPALAGGLARSPLTRFALGAAAWCSMLSVATALDLPPHLGITAGAGGALATLGDPASVLGALCFGLGAAACGWVLRARHFAIAALGALLWAAAVTAALGFVGNGELASSPPLIAAAALGAVAVTYAGSTALPGPPPHPRAARVSDPAHV